MAKKGQIEIIALFGVIFLVVVVVFYAYQTGTFGISPVPAGVAEQQKAVKNTVNNFIRLGAEEMLSNMSFYGGYMNEGAFYSDTQFSGRPIAYWYKDGTVAVPANVYASFTTGLTNYIKAHASELIEDLQLENVTVDVSAVSVSGNILADSIVLNVYMPVYVQGYIIPQPLTVTIYSRFGESVELANNIVSFVSTSRPFEWFTLSSMVVSPLNDGQPTIPVFVTLLDCGQTYVKSWLDVMPEVETTIKKTLANTYMPGKAPLGTLETSSSPKYTMPSFYGKDYSQLDVSFHVPDDFQLSSSSFQMNPSTIVSYAKPIYMTTICQSDPLFVNYYIKYPVIVRIRDPDTGNIFQFATDVSVYNNEPRNWLTPTTDFDPAGLAELCSDNVCQVQATVKDGSGNPVDGARLTYMGCSVGETNHNGVVYSRIPCGAGPLEAYKEGYKFWRKNLAWNDFVDNEFDIVDYPITLKKTISFDVNIHEVFFEEHTSTYILRSVDPLDEKMFRFTFKPQDEAYCEGTNVYCDRTFTSASGEMSVAAGKYSVFATLMSSDWTKMYGAFGGGFEFTDSMDGRTLHIYVPSNNHEFPALPEEDRAEYIGAYMDAFQECGISPISMAELNPDKLPCEVTHAEIGL